MWKRKLYGLLIGIALAQASIAQFWGGGKGEIRRFGGGDCVNCQQAAAAVPFPADVSKLLGKNIAAAGNVTGFTHGDAVAATMAPNYTIPAPVMPPAYQPSIGMAPPVFQLNPNKWNLAPQPIMAYPNAQFGYPGEGTVYFGY